MPIDPSEIKVDRPASSRTGNIDVRDIKPDSKPWKFSSEIINTLKNLGQGGLPAYEVAASMATSMYGVPISGLVALAALPFGAEESNRALEAVQKALIYQPQTEGGKQLLQTASLPAEKVHELANWTTEKNDNNVFAAITQGAIEAVPALIGLRGKPPVSANSRLKPAIDKGINKGIRPSVSKKEMWQQRQKYMQNANVAVEEIINNKNELILLDRDGNKSTGRLPETLEEFSQAVEQTKQKIYSKYDELSVTADQRGAGVNTGSIISELRNILDDEVLKTIHPQTVEYAKSRMDAFTKPPPKHSPFSEPKSFSTQKTQQMIQMLNQSEKAYYDAPSPKTYGEAMVDALVANNLRASVDAAIESATGIEYAPLKRKYGALRMLETDVTKRAIVDARKNIRGLVDFSDIFSSSQLVQGLIAKQPELVASGAVVRGTSSIIKWINDPNRIVKSMFKNAEQYMRTVPGTDPKMIGAGTPISSMSALEGEEE